MKRRLDLGELQFYWRMADVPAGRDSDVPAFLPFAFSFDPALGLVIQERNPQVLDWLRRIYEKEANVGYLQDGHALAKVYGDAFLDFLERATAARESRPRSVADIGCGGVYLLRALQGRGLDVCGVDPSPVTRLAAERAGVPILAQFYPLAGGRLGRDLIIHYDVLEHTADPVSFLQRHRGDLNPGGCIVFAVPDCTEHIASGDISMALHEHLNYFDEVSLERTVRAAGFRPLRIERASYGGVLYCAAEPDGEGARSSEVGWAPFERFRANAERTIKSFAALARKERALGVYVPLRGLPYLSTIGLHDGVRFFDDDPGLHGRYFDGFPSPVENFEDFVRRPTDVVLVASLAFGDKIAARIRERVGDRSEIVVWRDFCGLRAVAVR